MLRLRDHLRLYAKKRRCMRGYRRQNILKLLSHARESKAVSKIQALGRAYIARKRVRFFRVIHLLRCFSRVRRRLVQRCQQARVTRDKETKLVQRYAISKIEVESINKYIAKAEQTFEQNWSAYEAQLKTHITGDKSNPKLYVDWVQTKNDAGDVYWTNLKTLEKTLQHPGERIF